MNLVITDTPVHGRISAMGWRFLQSVDGCDLYTSDDGSPGVVVYYGAGGADFTWTGVNEGTAPDWCRLNPEVQGYVENLALLLR